MSSAQSFNPDDFEDNNPFGSSRSSNLIPEGHMIGVQINDAGNSTTLDQGDETNEATEPDLESENKENVTNKSAVSIIKKVLPERYAGHKSSISIKLKHVEKNKPGNPILKFDAVVIGLPKYRQKYYNDIRRTYNELSRFSSYLAISNLEVFVPVLPPAVTSYPAGGVTEMKTLTRRFQDWIDRITGNYILIRDEEFVFFIESDFGYSVINSNRKSSIASGLVRKTLKQLAPPFDPYEDLASFRPTIKAFYLVTQKLQKILEKKSKTGKQLSASVGDMALKLIGLSEFELFHPGMKNMWEKLSKLTTFQADMIFIQSTNDMGILGDEIQIMSNEFYEIKEALTNRYLIMRELSQAEAQTKAKHQQASKIRSKSSFDPLKVDEAIRSLEYATKAEESLSLQVSRISEEMRFERKEIIANIDKRIKNTFKLYTLSKIEYHRKILKHMENIRLDVRIIDEKGGLSRLNRENLSNLKHNLNQSQSSSGDSWSARTFRSLSHENDHPKTQDFTQVNAKSAATVLGVATFS